MYYKTGLKHYYYYFRVNSNKYYCLLKKTLKPIKKKFKDFFFKYNKIKLPIELIGIHRKSLLLISLFL